MDMALQYASLSAVRSSVLVQQAGVATTMHLAMKSLIHESYPFAPYSMDMALQYSNYEATELPSPAPMARLAIAEHPVVKGEMPKF